MTAKTSLRTVVGLSIAGASMFGLVACGSSSPSSSNTPSTSPSSPMTQAAGGLKARLAEVKVCGQVAKDLQGAAPILAKVSSNQISPTTAITDLKPMATQIDKLAMANASLPIGPALTKLSNDIAAAQKSKATTPAAIKAEVATLTGDASAALMHCAK